MAIHFTDEQEAIKFLQPQFSSNDIRKGAIFDLHCLNMKSSVIPAASDESFAPGITLNGSGIGGVESLVVDEESSLIPHHPLGLKPSGNQYTALSNARHNIGRFQALPDEIIALLLEYFNCEKLRLLGSTCKELYAFCRSDELWKSLFIEYVDFIYVWAVSYGREECYYILNQGHLLK